MRSSSNLLALAGVLVAAAEVPAASRITVAAEGTVAGEVVRLGDLATLEGADAEGMRELALASAPPAGESRLLDGTVVLQALRRGGLDGSAIIYTIPPAVRVRRAAQEVSEGAVRQIVETFLADAFGEGFADVAVRSIELPGPIRIPLGPYGARVLVSPGTQLVGRTRLQVEFTAGDRPVKTVWVVADVERYGSAVVARRAIARGEPIQAEDLQVDRRELTQMPREIVTRVEDAVGTVARTALVPYVPIRRDQVAVAPLVRRGDAVLLVLEHGLLRLSAPGEVRHDAGPGEQVRVVNRSSRRELVGRVLDARTVAVEF